MAETYQEALRETVVATLTALHGLETAMRFLHPPQLPTLREALLPHAEGLQRALAASAAVPVPEAMAAFHGHFAEAASRTARAFDLFLEPSNGSDAIVRVLSSMRATARALESLYVLHRFPPVSRFFVEAAFHDHLDELDPDPREGIRTGLHHGGPPKGTPQPGDARDARGGFCLYVPERWDGQESLPLVVALHGGSGSGRDFLWTWLREARGRRFLLAAPTSRGSTWSLDQPEEDGRVLRALVAWIGREWKADLSRVLLTGLSDGATFTLLEGLSPGSPFTHLAPVAGVLHPANIDNGNLAHAAGRRIRLVHGRLDWMFPVETAEIAAHQLQHAGANLSLRLVDDLSHAWPREENDGILSWFDPTLALPERRGVASPTQPPAN